jgi:hypothetical protein
MRDFAHCSTASAGHAVQFFERWIGRGNVPFFTQPHIVLGATPPAISRTCGKRKNLVGVVVLFGIASSPNNYHAVGGA